MRIRMFIPVLLCAMMPLNGCMLLPIPTTERKVLAGKPVTQEQLAFLAPNITTKEEVKERLGSPDVIWEEAYLFAYNWVVRQGVLIWAIGGGYSADAGLMDIPKRYVLLIQFDEQARLRRFERVVRPEFKSYGALLKEWVRSSEKTPPQGSNNRKE
jgi:hypothetical protein